MWSDIDFFWIGGFVVFALFVVIAVMIAIIIPPDGRRRKDMQ